MSVWMKRSKRKVTGSRYNDFRIKRKRELGRPPAMTAVGEKKVRKVKKRGGSEKLRALALKKVNLLNQKNKKLSVEEIIEVIQNSANRNFPRLGIMTKGAVIQTKIGQARITNKPSQEGCVNAVLINTEVPKKEEKVKSKKKGEKQETEAKTESKPEKTQKKSILSKITGKKEEKKTTLKPQVSAKKIIKQNIKKNR